MPRLELHDVRLDYGTANTVRALDGVDLIIEQGEFVAVDGPSGGGKSTLLNVLGLLDRPTSGTYTIDGRPSPESDAAAARVRSDMFAFVFQSFHLLGRRPVLHSVELGLTHRAVARHHRRRRARAALETVGLLSSAHQAAHTLSGGQQQRVAIARALASQTPVLLADEPTGNLDTANSRAVVAALRAVNARGITVVLVTHDPQIAEQADRHVTVVDGRIVSDITRPIAPPGGSASGAAPAPAALAPAAPGDASRVRASDWALDVASSLASRPGRTVGLALAVAAAVGLTVATVGLTTSAAAQVSSSFDAAENRYVTVTEIPATAPDGQVVTGWTPPDDETRAVQLGQIAGVEAAAVLADHNRHQVTSVTGREPQDTTVYAATASFQDATGTTVEWSQPSTGHLLSGQVLIGQQLAAELELGPTAAGAIATVDGRRVWVAGVITRSDRIPALTGAVIVPSQDAPSYGEPGQVSAYVIASTGAAQQVARAAPLAFDPTAVEALTVKAPVDPRTLRSRIESNVRTAMVVLTATALLASVLALMNATVMAVNERRAELALRRALGARRTHLALLIQGESAATGALGGLAGSFLGTYGVLAVTVARHWTPVLDPRIAPVAVLLGVLLGALGGLTAAVVGTRVQPARALRQ